MTARQRQHEAYCAALALIRPVWDRHPDLTLAEVIEILRSEDARRVADLFCDLKYWAIVVAEDGEP